MKAKQKLRIGIVLAAFGALGVDMLFLRGEPQVIETSPTEGRDIAVELREALSAGAAVDPLARMLEDDADAANGVGAMFRVVVASGPEAEQVRRLDIAVTSIMTAARKRIAVIDGRAYREGDTIRGRVPAEVERIDASGVWLVVDGEHQFHELSRGIEDKQERDGVRVVRPGASADSDPG